MQIQPNISEADVKARPGTSAPPMAATAAPRSALSGEFHDLIEDIEDFVKNTTALTGQDLARATARTTDSYVHDHPWQAIGIGAALGLLIGVVISRSR